MGWDVWELDPDELAVFPKDGVGGLVNLYVSFLEKSAACGLSKRSKRSRRSPKGSRLLWCWVWSIYQFSVYLSLHYLVNLLPRSM